MWVTEASKQDRGSNKVDYTECLSLLHDLTEKQLTSEEYLTLLWAYNEGLGN